MPGAIPVTVPVLPTVATEVFELCHTPPGVTSSSAVIDPTHTVGVPVIGAEVGKTPTETTIVAIAEPHPLFTE